MSYTTTLLSRSLKAVPPYGTIDLLFWGKEVSAKQGAPRKVSESGAGLPRPTVEWGLPGHPAECAESECSVGLPRRRRGLYAGHASESPATFFPAPVVTHLLGTRISHSKCSRALRCGRSALSSAHGFSRAAIESRTMRLQPLRLRFWSGSTQLEGACLTRAQQAFPFIRFSRVNLAQSTRHSCSSRIARKSLKTLISAPVYPAQFSTPGIAQFPPANRLASQLPAFSFEVPACA